MAGRIKVWRPVDLVDIELRLGTTVAEPYPRHWHEEYQLCLITDEGGGHLAYRGDRYQTPIDSLFIVHPGEVHSNDPDLARGCSFRSIYISPERVRQVAVQIAGKERAIPFFPCPMVFDQDIVGLYLNLHLCLETSGSRLTSEALLLELLVKLITRYASESYTLDSLAAERHPIKRVRDFLYESYAENVSLDELGRIAGLSPFHLSRRFCQEVGMPPHEFQTQVRIARAKNLLRQGHSISYVATMTGFTDQSHLTRHFKRLVQLTPGQYLQDSKNVQDHTPAPC